MPGRKIPLVNGEIYHVFNRGIDHRPIFTDKREYSRALETIKYYQHHSPSIRLSVYLAGGVEKRETFLQHLSISPLQVEIIAYCLMPNHFHLLLKQTLENGISKFLSNSQNSYTRYFNSRKQRIGPLLLDQFQAVRCETEEQLVHLTRYIHLNPFTAYIIKNLADLATFPWSSFGQYIGESKNDICKNQEVLSLFKTKEQYKNFVYDQADYQRKLKTIKYLTLG